MNNSAQTPRKHGEQAPRKHGIRYPWDEWFKEERITLTRNVDFTGEPHGMMQTARQAAARRCLSISVGVIGDKVTIRVTKRSRCK